jgi:hypothetical protein
MSRLRIQLEPVGAMRTQLEVGQLQRARHRHRPLLTSCGNHRHGLAVADPGPGGLRLHCRDTQDAQHAAMLARRALATLGPLRDLLGACPEQVTVDGSGVRIQSAFPPYLLHRLLDSVKAMPDGTGTAGPDAIDFVEYPAPDAVAAFERGDLQATAPTSFEIARDCSTDPRFRRYELDVFALLLIGPRRPDRRAVVRGRRLLRDRLAAEPELAGQLTVTGIDQPADQSSGQVPGPAEPTGGEAELLYADFWPNASIARALCAALAELGTPARPRAVGLDEAHTRTSTGAFELALVLANGYAGPRLSMPLTLARSAALTQPPAALGGLRDALADAITGPEDGPAWPAVTAAALHRVPAVPLGSLRGGSLVDPVLPDAPLAYGCVLPLEHYVGGCRA